MNTTWFISEAAAFTFLIYFLLGKTGLNKILSLIFHWMTKIFICNLSSSLKIYLMGRRNENLREEQWAFPCSLNVKPKQKQSPIEIPTLNFFEILRLNKSKKALYESVISTYLCQFSINHDLTDYLSLKAHLSKRFCFSRWSI